MTRDRRYTHDQCPCGDAWCRGCEEDDDDVNVGMADLARRHPDPPALNRRRRASIERRWRERRR